MSIAEETKQQLMFLADTYAAAAVNWTATGQHSDDVRAVLSAAIADLVAERDALQVTVKRLEVNAEVLQKLHEEDSAEWDVLAAERDAWKQSNADQIELLNRIADERDALAKDAARYRWIREGDGDNQVMTYVVGLDDWTPWSCPEDVDAAIDTALKLGL